MTRYSTCFITALSNLCRIRAALVQCPENKNEAKGERNIGSTPPAQAFSLRHQRVAGLDHLFNPLGRELPVRFCDFRWSFPLSTIHFRR